MITMTFEKEHEAFIQWHLERRAGERKGRLERGHLEAETLFCKQVWWPLRGNFLGLHPEYEVLDWRGYSYFCDFVYMTGMEKIVIEIKGFGPHVKNMDRQKYCNELNRETFLTSIGYHVISFAYDDVAQRPELCVTLLRMVLSRFEASATPVTICSLAERETIRLAYTLARPLRVADVAKHVGIDRRTAVKALRSLCDHGLFTSVTVPNGKYVVKYVMKPHALFALR
jgi:very-short-patch-repair endonuclease